jgi:hypothetical protein
MKKIIVILCLLIVSRGSLKAQTGVPDTLAYLQSIVHNKAQYIGQPFSKLMDSLKIQIKCFSPFASLPYDMTKETSTTFGFYFPLNPEEMYLTYPRLKIIWQTALNANQSLTLYNQSNSGWTPSVISFYTPAIIADIKILE